MRTEVSALLIPAPAHCRRFAERVWNSLVKRDTGYGESGSFDRIPFFLDGNQH